MACVKHVQTGAHLEKLAGPIQRKQKQGIKKPWSRRSNTEETTKQQRS